MTENYAVGLHGTDSAMDTLGAITDVFDDGNYMSVFIRDRAMAYILETGTAPVDDRVRKLKGPKCDIPGMHYMDASVDIMANYVPIPDKEAGEPYVGVLRTSSLGNAQFEVFTERQLDVLQSRYVMNKRDAMEDIHGRLGGW